MKAFIFPGQGSQSVGMGKSLYENYSTAKEVFEEINDSLGLNITKIMFEGPDSELGSTENTQPAIMAVSLAVIKVLEKDYGFNIKDNISYMAGHSLGEYSALSASGVFDIKTVAKLLKIRGKAMQSAMPVGLGGMVAVLGINDITKVEELINASKKENEVCVVANDNCVGQVVISGHMSAIDRVVENAKSFGAMKAVKLSVSGSFHSPLMQSASELMAEQLNTTTFNKGITPVVSNVLAKEVLDSNEFKGLLVQQVVKGVRWRESMDRLVSLGITEFIEVGHGAVLTGLIKRISPNAVRTNLQEPKDIDNFINNIK